jgi:hypothetical protein
MSDHRERIAGPARGRMQAWVAPDVDTPWYPIEAMRWAGLPVIVMLEKGGAAVLAVARKQARPKGVWWYQLGSWGGDGYGWLKHDEIRLAAYGRTPPAPKSPVAFRPVDPARWVHPLPAPIISPLGITEAFGPNRPAPAAHDEPEPVNPDQGSDDWPHPGLALGLGTPASLEECEARILRAFRTSNAQARVGHGASALCSDIPKEIVLVSVRLNELWWSVQPDADGSAFDAVRSGWSPSKRDKEDWVNALDWLHHIDRRALKILALRAADPPWSFRQIAERLWIKSHNTVRRMYEHGIAAAFEQATKEATREQR